MKVNRIQSLVLALAVTALSGGTVLAGPGPQQPAAAWVRESATPMQMPIRGRTTVAFGGRRYVTEEDVPASRSTVETRSPRFTNFGQGNTAVRW